MANTGRRIKKSTNKDSLPFVRRQRASVITRGAWLDASLGAGERHHRHAVHQKLGAGDDHLVAGIQPEETE